MKARLIRYYGKLHLLCADGTIADVTDNVLRRLFVGHAGADKLTGKAGRWKADYSVMENHPGKSLVWVEDDGTLVIKENVFISFVESVKEEDYVTAQEYAEHCGRSVARVKTLCQDGRIPGAFKKSGRWFIPRQAPFPDDARYSGVEK